MDARARVLVVDDEESVRRSYSRLLGELDCDAQSAGDGEQALHAMERQPADAVLLDLKMPGATGLEVLETLKRRWPESEVVVITGYPTVESAKRALQLGACGYPFRPPRDGFEQPTKEHAMTQQSRFLVVDDDPVVAKSIDRVLSAKGYAVITAHDGPQALDKLAREKYDAVFADIRMPGMSGLEVAARIKQSQPWLPVVIVTGYGSAESEALAKDIGVSSFLRKPLSPEMIESGARDALLSAQAAPAAAPADAPAPVAVQAAPQPVAKGAARKAKDIALFIAAPFIGLGYAVAFPFVGLWLLGRYAYQAFKARRS
jgi:DNA-binding NtrC family response regulator